MKRREILRIGTIGAAALALGYGGNGLLETFAEKYDDIPLLGRYANTEENIGMILERAGDSEIYVFVGERHPDSTIYSGVLLPLIKSGKFSSIYLEALGKGDYRREGPDLFNSVIVKYNPDKYGRIIEKSLEEGMEVHGINSRGSCEEDGVSDWAKYITEHGRHGSKIVLTGGGHLYSWRRYRRRKNHDILPAYLSDFGVPGERIVTISTFITGGIPPGLYRTRDLPEVKNESLRILKEKRATDYIWIRN